MSFVVGHLSEVLLPRQDGTLPNSCQLLIVAISGSIVMEMFSVNRTTRLYPAQYWLSYFRLLEGIVGMASHLR